VPHKYPVTNGAILKSQLKEAAIEHKSTMPWIVFLTRIICHIGKNPLSKNTVAQRD
jgi:hypothetical protein